MNLVKIDEHKYAENTHKKRYPQIERQTNAVFFSNILGLVIGYHKAQLYLVWLS